MNPCCFGSPNHGYPADHWGARNRDSRTCHVACVVEPRAEVERYSINFFFLIIVQYSSVSWPTSDVSRVLRARSTREI